MWGQSFLLSIQYLPLNKYALEKPSGKLYAFFIDLKKTYDSVSHKGLFSNLETINIGGKFLKIIKDMYEN